LFAHDLHVTLAVATVVAMAVVACEAAFRAVSAKPPRRFAEAVSVIAVILVGMTAAGGLAILTRGERPREWLHFVYAAFAFILVPFGDAMTARASPRRRALARLVTALVALGVVARLFATG
jgi:hypothetical protein